MTPSSAALVMREVVEIAQEFGFHRTDASRGFTKADFVRRDPYLVNHERFARRLASS